MTLGTLSFLFTFLLTVEEAGWTCVLTRMGFFWIWGRLLTRQEKFCLISSLPILESWWFTKCLSALKRDTWSRLDFIPIWVRPCALPPPEFRVVFDFELMLVPRAGFRVGMVLITHKYSYMRITRTMKTEEWLFINKSLDLLLRRFSWCLNRTSAKLASLSSKSAWWRFLGEPFDSDLGWTEKSSTVLQTKSSYWMFYRLHASIASSVSLLFSYPNL